MFNDKSKHWNPTTLETKINSHYKLWLRDLPWTTSGRCDCTCLSLQPMILPLFITHTDNCNTAEGCVATCLVFKQPKLHSPNSSSPSSDSLRLPASKSKHSSQQINQRPSYSLIQVCIPTRSLHSANERRWGITPLNGLWCGQTSCQTTSKLQNHSFLFL